MATAKYIVTEESLININDNPVKLHRNAILQTGKNGQVYGVTIEGEGVTLNDSDAVTALIAQGTLVKIEEPEEETEEEP